MNVKKCHIKHLDERFFDRRSIIEDVYEDVKRIIDDVRRGGDDAIIRLENKFDGADIDNLSVTDEEFNSAFDNVDQKTIDCLSLAYERIYSYHDKQKRKNWFIEKDGSILGEIFVPMENIGCYVPSSYFSSLLMSVIPAKVAGVKNISVCTPPNKKGIINDLVLIAAKMTNVSVYKVGGAQAIAGMAYGTESIPKVEKIVGPGNKYVTAAKILLRDRVEIDFPAGPSELLIIADDSANSSFLALDLLAQAEHDYSSIAVLITTSQGLIEAVENDIRREDDTNRRKGSIYLIKSDSIDDSIRITNDFAPEHLEIVTKDSIYVLKHIKNAGSIFIGNYSPVAAGDYASGTNHILPTAGYAKVLSGLSVDDFIKRISVQMLDKEALKVIGGEVIYMAKKEGLKTHARSIERRIL
ncbi:MAG: histidinol dehydrogenase [Candidatus Methanoliparum thermophilum]|uniref:Histidinol dehydrogenase n=1 Tax=Methanoliparum thermophilum TaxID=2491083 RepID=A0A520KR66_METT2|nr:histidinol dehydrogenase [Candidatus Methanoliparum sp. LAM-1]RZN64071.1 MAG: histidinol dehydrogenase [Candidatus Methanoliparum thermophilum]BDC35672.1 histidinol dehydrogenase [Candidatus Methanoliparum sp. LAM-1]